VSHRRTLACAAAACLLISVTFAQENTPASAIEKLKHGNKEFAAGRIDSSKLMPTTGAASKPVATVL